MLRCPSSKEGDCNRLITNWGTGIPPDTTDDADDDDAEGSEDDE